MKNWNKLAVINVLLILATYIFAPIIAIFVVKRNGYLDNNTKYGQGYYLVNWLSWFQTPDNSIDGDEGWRIEHWQWRFKLPSFLATYVGRIGWLWRNTAYGYGLISTANLLNQDISENGNTEISFGKSVEGSFTIICGDYFQKRKVVNYFGIGVYTNTGWNIQGTVNEIKNKSTISGRHCTFACSIRFFKFK